MGLNTYVIKTLTGKEEVEPFDEFPLTWFRPEPPAINIGHENIRGAWEKNNKGLEIPVAVHPTYLHPRMSAQRSAFTVHGTKKLSLDELVPSSLISRFEIQSLARQTISHDLAILGIQETTAYPDLDGLTRELSSLY